MIVPDQEGLQSYISSPGKEDETEVFGGEAE